MILTCPECATRYQTDAANFMPSGRKVRCAKCGHVWFQAPPAPEPEIQIVHEEPVAEPEPEPEPQPRPEPNFRQRVAYAPPEPAYEEDVEEATRPRSRILDWLGYTLG